MRGQATLMAQERPRSWMRRSPWPTVSRSMPWWSNCP